MATWVGRCKMWSTSDFVWNFVAMTTRTAPLKIWLTSLITCPGEPPGRRKHLGDISYARRVIGDFVLNFVAMATGLVGCGDIATWNFSNMAVTAILDLLRNVNSAVRSAVPENPTLEQNMKWIGSPVAEIWPFAYVGGIWNPHFGGRGGRGGSAMAPLERAMVVFYRLSIIRDISVTIRPQFAIECLRRSHQQGVGDVWPKFRFVPLAADPSCWGCKERTSQAN